ncbi:esterase [soil metagenome]
MNKGKLTVSKTARYFTLGNPDEKVKTVIFVCHGYAQLADEFLKSFEPVLRDELFIVAPEGLHRFYTKGHEKVVASWMTKIDREDDIQDYILFLDKLCVEVMQLFPQKVNVIALGFSQGAATVSRWIAKGNVEVSEMILWCGFFPPDLELKNIPKNLNVKLFTASDDRFMSTEEQKKQIIEIKKAIPGVQHFEFQGKHEMEEVALRKLFLEY